MPSLLRFCGSRWRSSHRICVGWTGIISTPSLLAAIRRVGRTDFGSASSISAFFDWLPEHSHARLVNVQCEVLAARGDRQCYRNPAEMAEVAIGNLPMLGFVGFAERMERDLGLLFRRLGLPGPPLVTRQNTLSSHRRIDIAIPAIRVALARHVEADRALYRHATRQRRPRWRRGLF